MLNPYKYISVNHLKKMKLTKQNYQKYVKKTKREFPNGETRPVSFEMWKLGESFNNKHLKRANKIINI